MTSTSPFLVDRLTLPHGQGFTIVATPEMTTVSERWKRGKAMVDVVVFQVEGMTCGGCEERIAKVLERLDGVRQVAADHRRGHVRVGFDPGQVAPEAMAGRIEAAGYRVVGTVEVGS
jgi:copper chaperone CopZ